MRDPLPSTETKGSERVLSDNIDFSSKETKEASIEKEIKRLTSQFSKIEPKKKKLTIGLIERAAFMRVALAELEDDLNTYGFWEWFSQGDQEPYQRKRPASEIYSQMNKNYQSIIKQLSDLLPKTTTAETDDGFDSFVNGRDD